MSITPTREAAAHDVVGRTRSKPPLRKENTCDIRGQVKCKCRLAAPQIQRLCTLDFLAGWALHTTAAPMALATKQKVGLEMLGVSVCTYVENKAPRASANPPASGGGTGPDLRPAPASPLINTPANYHPFPEWRNP